MTDNHPRPAPQPQLSLFDSVAIVVGIVIGAGIFGSSPDVAQCVDSFQMLLLVWGLGGMLALVGSLCYGELATIYPKDGGDYIYLTEAFGPRIGFVYSWCQLWVIRPGSLGAIAFVFAEYFAQLIPDLPLPYPLTLYAAGAIVVLSALNLLGLREGKWTQNILTALKVIGLLAIFAVALLPAAEQRPPVSGKTNQGGFPLALILVLFTYGGWNDLTFVTAEIRNPRRNIIRALLLGVACISLIYLLVNIAFVRILSFEGLQSSPAVAADAMAVHWGDAGRRFISLLICISCLGAINGMIFTGARVYYATGRQHTLFSRLGNWNPSANTPTQSMIVQTIIALAVLFLFGLNPDGFRRMVEYTTPVFWFFFFFVGLSLFVLRWKHPQARRTFRVPGYPVTPLIFCAACVYIFYSSITYAFRSQSWYVLWALGLLVLGILLSLFDRSSTRSTPPTES